ncbi:MAG: HK97 gp10 family phage protein [Bacteroidales bacterium]|jgi:hypothetical protein|nr:HK97 gp10 family phage protein [Bacteroidales bacterium]
MAGVQWEPDREGIDALLSSPEAVGAMGEIAAIAGAQVERAMPERTGATKRSIVTGAGVEDGRAVGVVGTTSSIWHFLEYGAAGTVPSRPFARGMQAAGLEYEATGR